MTLNFLVRASKSGRNGLAPLELSIIQNGERKVITLPHRVNPKLWNASKQKVKKDAVINEYIDTVRNKFFSIEVELIKRGESCSLSNLLNIYNNGFKDGSKGIITFYNEYLIERKNSKSTSYDEYQKHAIVFKYLTEFLKGDDVALKNITPKLVEDFYSFLITEKKHKQNSAIQKMKKIKKILQLAVDERLIEKTPYKLKLQTEKLTYDILTVEELRAIKAKEFGSDRLTKVRDVMLVAAFTGLAYTDLKSLTKADVQGDVIIKNRHKTDVQSTIPLLPVAREILEKYDYVLPILSNQKMNCYIKEIVALCQINKDIHCHSLRHSFATNLLNNGVDMTTVSKCCGHSNTRITEAIYAKLHTDTIRNTVLSVADRLS